MGVYRLGYYPHNVHFVMASAQMAGDGPTVIAAAEKLRGLIPDEVARGIAMVQPVKAAPYFAHAQFSTPEIILALPDPGGAIPYVKAMWLYARGVALAARRDFGGATEAANEIEELGRTADFKLLNDSNVPAQEVLRIARTLIVARVAQAKGQNRTAIVQFERAAALQDALPYTEPPLVLPDPAVSGRCPNAGWPLQRGGATVRARAQSCAVKWLVVLWTRGTAQGTREHRQCAQS